MMFDLNLSGVYDEQVMEADESGTSNSSARNAEACSSTGGGDDDTCSARAGDTFTFDFDILKVGGANKNDDDDDDDDECDDESRRGVMTQQLFPVDDPEFNQDHHAPRRPDWMSLSVDPSNGISFRGAGTLQPPPQLQPQPQQVKKSRRGPRSRSSQYRGVTFYRRTGRWESHIWDCGKQVYLGGFDTAHAAARAYDRAAIKFRGVDADINFTLSDYDEDMKQMKNLSKEEFVHVLRRQSTGFSRGSSKYRGVTLHKCGRWEARMGQFLGKKAYDKAAIKCNGREAVTNFEPGTYDGVPVSDHRYEGSQQDLDLNLGIGTSSPKKNEKLGGFQYQTYGMLDTTKPQGEKSSPPIAGSSYFKSHSVTSEQAQLWNGAYSNVYTSYEAERSSGKRIDVGSSANWALQMQGQVGTIPMSMLSAAASSGFSTPATTTAPATLISSLNPNSRNFSFPSYSTTSTNTGQYHNPVRLPPP